MADTKPSRPAATITREGDEIVLRINAKDSGEFLIARATGTAPDLFLGCWLVTEGVWVQYAFPFGLLRNDAAILPTQPAGSDLLDEMRALRALLQKWDQRGLPATTSGGAYE